ncbi:MAG: nuclear transport factor 2 family protein [Thermoleophilaceae bacterium]|nr:nuclear transport factor 2 family protein [Thermoleophilaceae bacterium]
MPGSAEVVRRAYEALGRRDFHVLAGLAAPDFEMDLSQRVLNPATYRGAEGLLRFLGEIEELWAKMDIDVECMLERGDDVLAVLLVKLQGRGSGVKLDSRIAQRWELREGKLVRMRLRPDVEAALAEFEEGG